MKRRIWIAAGVFGILLSAAGAGCGREEGSEASGGRLYFLNEAETQLVSETYEVKATFREAKVQEYVEALGREPENRGCKRLLPDNVALLDYSFGEAGQLILNFDANYSSLSGITEILIRAALVKTFCQIEGVDYVEFYVNGIPCMSGDVPVGLMRADDFIDENMYGQIANVSVFFANEDGTALLESHRQVSYSASISMEQLVIEQLLAGPVPEEAEAGMCPTMPQGTELIKVSTKDGVCYVDLNEKFLERPEGLSEEVIVYSVVNSLVELPNINKVQFRIDGETRKAYQSVPLSELLERNLNLIETEN